MRTLYSVEPVPAARFSRLRLVGTRVELASLYNNAAQPAAARRNPSDIASGARLDVFATAVCGEGKTHLSPDEDCNCGLYGYKSVELLAERSNVGFAPGIVMCRTELSGKIVEGEYGYRGQHQRTLEVVLDWSCWCGGEAVAVQHDSWPASGRAFSTFWVDSNAMSSVCEAHATVPMELSVLRDHLGTDVSFGPVRELSPEGLMAVWEK